MRDRASDESAATASRTHSISHSCFGDAPRSELIAVVISSSRELERIEPLHRLSVPNYVEAMARCAPRFLPPNREAQLPFATYFYLRNSISFCGQVFHRSAFQNDIASDFIAELFR